MILKHNNQEIKELKPEHIEAMSKCTIFASGISDDGLLSAAKVKWVAYRGCKCEWSIYYTSDLVIPFNMVRSSGDKVTQKINVNRLVECNKKVYKYYRGFI